MTKMARQKWICHENENSFQDEIKNIFHHFFIEGIYAAQKMNFFIIKDFRSKCDQIRSFLRIWLHLLNKSLIENFVFCAVLSLTSW